jgi:hypothetical protein
LKFAFQREEKDFSNWSLSKLAARNWPIYLDPREIWRRTGDRKSGQQEVFVQDPNRSGDAGLQHRRETSGQS